MSFSLFKLLSLTELFLCLFVCLFSLYIHHLVCIKSCTDFCFFSFLPGHCYLLLGGVGVGAGLLFVFHFFYN